MVVRVITGGTAMVLFLALLLAGQEVGLLAAAALFGAIATHELVAAVRRQTDARPPEAWACIGVLLAVLAAAGTDVPPPVIIGAALVWMMAGLAWEAFRREPAPLRNLGPAAVGVAWIGGGLSALLLLYRLPGAPAPGWPHVPAGAWATLWVAGCTWAADSGAFFVGRAWGRRRLAPALSPGKTWEGAAGGLAAACVAGWALAPALLAGRMTLLPGHLGAACLGAALGVVAPVGDLCQSAIKRELGVKDLGSLFPGHGGVLDRLDSLFFTASVAYVVFMLLAGAAGAAH